MGHGSSPVRFVMLPRSTGRVAHWYCFLIDPFLAAGGHCRLTKGMYVGVRNVDAESGEDNGRSGKLGGADGNSWGFCGGTDVGYKC